MPVPGELSVRSFQFLVARTLISVADVGRHHVVITDGSVVYHCHNGDTQTHTQRGRAEDPQWSHDTEHGPPGRKVEPGLYRVLYRRLCRVVFLWASGCIFRFDGNTGICSASIIYAVVIDVFGFWVVRHITHFPTPFSELRRLSEGSTRYTTKHNNKQYQYQYMFTDTPHPWPHCHVWRGRWNGRTGQYRSGLGCETCSTVYRRSLLRLTMSLKVSTQRRIKVSHPNLYSFLGHSQQTTTDQMNDMQREVPLRKVGYRLTSSHWSCMLHSTSLIVSRLSWTLQVVMTLSLQLVMTKSLQVLMTLSCYGALEIVCVLLLLCLVSVSVKLCMTVYKCLHGMGPIYLSAMCRPSSSEAGRRAFSCDLCVEQSSRISDSRHAYLGLF